MDLLGKLFESIELEWHELTGFPSFYIYIVLDQIGLKESNCSSMEYSSS
jgi:hypothetical protein